MRESNKGSVEEYTWNQVAENVRQVNPAFAEIVDEISPDSTYKLVLAKYPFGSTIIDNNIYHLPAQDGQISPAGDTSIASNIRQILDGYNKLPMGILLNNSVELFMDLEDRIVPFDFYMKGKIFALWGHLDPQISYQCLQILNMTAGARSIGMLPKITDTLGHKRLQQATGIKLPPPGKIQDEWALFVEIYRNSPKTYPWFTEMLFFSKKWLHSIKNDKAWARLHAFLLQEAWDSSSFWRGQMQFNTIFNKFIKYLSENQIKSSAKYLDISRHLLMISLGALPGFAPAVDEIGLPTRLIQETYLDDYGALRGYTPSIIQPQHFNFTSPTYYSLQWPTLLEFAPLPKTPVNIMTDLEEVHTLMEYFMTFLEDNFFHMEDTPLLVLKNIHYDGFHNSQSHNKKIKSSMTLPEKDKRFLHLSIDRKDNRTFCDAAQFMRGCIRISV